MEGVCTYSRASISRVDADDAMFGFCGRRRLLRHQVRQVSRERLPERERNRRGEALW
jgi:hypothetical protein